MTNLLKLFFSQRISIAHLIRMCLSRELVVGFFNLVLCCIRWYSKSIIQLSIFTLPISVFIGHIFEVKSTVVLSIFFCPIFKPFFISYFKNLLCFFRKLVKYILSSFWVPLLATCFLFYRIWRIFYSPSNLVDSGANTSCSQTYSTNNSNSKSL